MQLPPILLPPSVRRLARVFGAGIAAVLIAGFGAGCDTARFYSQGIVGQWEMVTKPRRIESVLADPATPEDLAQRLKVVGEILNYARTELHLPVGAQYSAYADLNRSNVVWNVFAAPEFSVEAKTWWYPLFGPLSYRGYFQEQSARDHATRLKARGYDVHVGAINAYSSLGWFEDPVLNTFVFDDDADLAELLFHELAHQRLFFTGDTDFNEAFATAVAEFATQQWLRDTGRTALLATYRQRLDHEREFRALALETREALRAVYAHGGTPDELRARKTAAIAAFEDRYLSLSAAWSDDDRFDRWFEAGVNNARLSALAAYYQLVPAFERALHRHETTEGFFLEMRELRRLTTDDRRAALAAAMAQAE